MADGAEDAIDRVIAATEEGRRMFRHYCATPGRLYLPPQLEHLRSIEYLDVEQVGLLLGASNARAAHAMVHKRRLRDDRGGGRFLSATPRIKFAAVEGHILRDLPLQMRTSAARASAIPWGSWSAAPSTRAAGRA